MTSKEFVEKWGRDSDTAVNPDACNADLVADLTILIFTAKREALEEAAKVVESLGAYADCDGVRWEHPVGVNTKCSKWGCSNMSHIASAIRALSVKP